MNTAMRWFAGNPVAVNLIMIIIFATGLVGLNRLPREILPNISTGIVAVTVPFPGASAVEAEAGICTRIESQLVGIDGIRDFQTVARQGACVATVRAENGYNVGDLAFDVRRRVESIPNLPSKALRPIVSEVVARDLVASVVVAGVTDSAVLRNIADRLRGELLKDPAITAVEILNTQPYEIAINVPQTTLAQYALSLDEVAAAVRMSSLNLPAGTVREGGQNVSIVVRSAKEGASAIENVLLRASPDGGRLYVSDVARVTEGYGEERVHAAFNGEPAVVLGVYRAAGEDVLRIAHATKRIVSEAAEYAPAGIRVAIWEDFARYLDQRLGTLGWNALQGFVLVYAMLAVAMRARYAFWTAMGIPFSFLGTFLVMAYFGLALNMVTLFGMLMALGMVVDDAIVVSESVHARNRNGEWGAEAAFQGARNVALPVTLAAVTTMVSFAPLFFVPYAAGQLLYSIPLVVIATLAFSVFEALFMLPNHLSYAKPMEDVSHRRTPGVVVYLREGINTVAKLRYQSTLKLILEYRYAVNTGFLMALLIILGMVASGRLPVAFYSDIEADTVTANVAFSEGTSLSRTAAAVKQLVAAARNVAEEMEAEYGVAQIGDVLSRAGAKGLEIGEHLGSVTIELADAGNRRVSSAEIARRWRLAAGSIPEAQGLSFDASLTPALPDIEVELYGDDLDTLGAAAGALEAAMGDVDGVYGVSTTHRRGRREVILELRPATQDIGLTLGHLADQVRNAFHGQDVQSFQRGVTEASVGIRYPSDERESGWFLENMPIHLPSGGVAPLSELARLKYGFSPAEILRKDGNRIVSVNALVDASTTNAAKVFNTLSSSVLPQVLSSYPDVGWRRGGVQERAKTYSQYMIYAFLLAGLLNYALVAVFFRSYAQALLVLYAIPFGIIGALLGHLIMGVEVTIWSVAGIIAVSGIVVNDNLVFMDYINVARRNGADLRSAILSAGGARFTSIVLTTVTTFGGVSALMFGRDLQSQFLVPMAVSVAFGVLFATVITLLMMPSAYVIVVEAQQLVNRLVKGRLFRGAAKVESTRAGPGADAT